MQRCEPAPFSRSKIPLFACVVCLGCLSFLLQRSRPVATARLGVEQLRKAPRHELHYGTPLEQAEFRLDTTMASRMSGNK
jgi:hypothetical protein